MPNWSFTALTIKGPKDTIDKLESFCDPDNQRKAIENERSSIDTDWLGVLLLQNGTRIVGEAVFIDEHERTTETELDMVLREAWTFHPEFYQTFADEFNVEIEFHQADIIDDESITIPYKIFPKAKSNFEGVI